MPPVTLSYFYVKNRLFDFNCFSFNDQDMECKIFKEIVGNNFVGAQVEDVFGTNTTMVSAAHRSKVRERPQPVESDGLGLYTPEIIADDCSSVFLVVNYRL